MILRPDLLQDCLNLTKDTVSTLLQIKQKRLAMSQQDNKSQITDEMVKAFINWEFNGQMMPAMLEEWERFKKDKPFHSSSEKVEKDYEIVSMKSNDGSITDNPGSIDFIMNHKGALPIKSRWSIHSVRRKSDGEVFSIGGKMTYPGGKDSWSTGKYCLINHFSIQDGQIYVNSHFAGKEEWTITDWIKAPLPEEKPSVKPPVGIMPELLYRSERFNHLSEAIDNYERANKNVPSEWRSELEELNAWLEDYHSKNKSEEKPVLFTTEDGREVFKGSTVWYIPRDCSRIKEWVATKIPEPLDGSFIYFSSQELANEYITMNKPCLSLTEIDNILAKEIREGGAFSSTPIRKIWHSLKQLASSKIQGGDGI